MLNVFLYFLLHLGNNGRNCSGKLPFIPQRHFLSRGAGVGHGIQKTRSTVTAGRLLLTLGSKWWVGGDYIITRTISRITFFLGYGAASLGKWILEFRNNLMFLLWRLKYLILLANLGPWRQGHYITSKPEELNPHLHCKTLAPLKEHFIPLFLWPLYCYAKYKC